MPMLNTAGHTSPPLSSAELLASLEKSTRAITNSEDIAAVAGSLLDLAVLCTSAERGSLLLKEYDHLRVLAGRGLAPETHEASVAKVGEGIAGTVAVKGTPVMVEDIDLVESFRGGTRDRYKTRSFISCPILQGSLILGVINLSDKADGTPFTASEFLLIRTVAHLAAIALGKAALERKLREKAAALHAAHMRLAENNTTRTRFLTRVSHELRTPLNAIGGAVFYLQGLDRISRSDQLEFSSIISNETAKLAQVVENLLGFFLVENRPGDVREEVLDLSELLRDVVSSSEQMIPPAKNIALILKPLPGPVGIIGDRVTAVQLMINLLLGLAGYASRGDVIRISVLHEDPVTVLSILNRPLPEGDLSGLFTAGDDERRIRLYLAEKAAQCQGWRLSARNVQAGCALSLVMPDLPQHIKDTIAARFPEFPDQSLHRISRPH
ncbi:MAG: GAF domain-containing protein [Nitrospiraceae bacterium]|nr:GAF domain-containing protein [Nitrospiraceae bacterium]